MKLWHGLYFQLALTPGPRGICLSVAPAGQSLVPIHISPFRDLDVWKSCSVSKLVSALLPLVNMSCPRSWPSADSTQGAGWGAVSRVSAYTASLNRYLGNFGVLILYLCLLDLMQAQTSWQQKNQADLPEEYQPVQFILLSFFPPMRCLAAHVSVDNPMRLRQMPCSRNTLALSFTWTLYLLTQESSGRTQHCFSPHFPCCSSRESIWWKTERMNEWTNNYLVSVNFSFLSLSL